MKKRDVDRMTAIGQLLIVVDYRRCVLVLRELSSFLVLVASYTLTALQHFGLIARVAHVSV